MDTLLYLQLFFEFSKVGLFAIGGGLATIPFLQELGNRTEWFTGDQLANMIAVSESTPGPIGVNMASFAGYETAGFFGAISATLGLITPSLIIVIMISRMLAAFKENPNVQAVFYGIRPASAGLITAAAVQVALVAFTKETQVGMVIFPVGVALGLGLWMAKDMTPLKKCHPICFLGLSALVGMMLGL